MVFRTHKEEANQRLKQHRGDERFQHELKEMQETHDLRDVDDDVEDLATLAEWYAPEHDHQDKSPMWFTIVAVGAAVLVAWFLFTFNFIGAITVAFASIVLYRVAQHEPKVMRYRLMTDGIAINNTLYHYRDIAAFNIVYHPGNVKAVFVKSKKHFTPLLHMSIGDADPVAIRDILIEFATEDQNMEEPVIDSVARRLGF